MSKTLDLRPSPHLRSGASVEGIMFNVVLALLPVTGFAIHAFGLAAVASLTTAVGVCVLTEHLLCRASGRRSTVGDWSAVITGLLFGLTLPPSLPLWMVAVGSVVAIAVAKHLFGGLGRNCFNPALVARAFLQAAFPIPMTTWLDFGSAERFAQVPSALLTAPLQQPTYDAITGATPLAGWKFDGVAIPVEQLVLGSTRGSAGETCAVLILAGGAWLVARKMMNWRIPAAIFATVALASLALHALDPRAHAGPSFMLASGGLMLGAVFMATDMVGSPMTHAGCVVYGVLIGVVVVAIRSFGGMPEGVMYAILIGNAATPHIDRLLPTRPYGTRGRRAEEAA